jgi:uncharacterized membrane protein
VINQRTYAAAELAALALLFAASFWDQIHVGVDGWVIVATWLFVLILPISALLRKHDWKESGFCLDNFVSGLPFTGIIVVVSVAVLLDIAALVGVSIQTPTAASTFRSISWGLVQEALLLEYFFNAGALCCRIHGLRLPPTAWFSDCFMPRKLRLSPSRRSAAFFSIACFSAIRMSS